MALISEGLYAPGIPGLVQTNITNSAEEKWALLDKDIEMELRMRTEIEQFYTTLFHFIITLCNNTNKYN